MGRDAGGSDGDRPVWPEGGVLKFGFQLRFSDRKKTVLQLTVHRPFNALSGHRVQSSVYVDLVAGVKNWHKKR